MITESGPPVADAVTETGADDEAGVAQDGEVFSDGAEGDPATYFLAALCLLRLDASKGVKVARAPLLRDIREGRSYFRSVRWL